MLLLWKDAQKALGTQLNTPLIRFSTTVASRLIYY
jgi:hypothetical protein